MKVSESLLVEAADIVKNVNDEIISAIPGCGCSGCGFGCSGTVGMDFNYPQPIAKIVRARKSGLIYSPIL